jgi:AraC-like DNA-binding protein
MARSWQMIYLDPERVAAEFQGAIKAEDILLRPVVDDPQLRGLMQRLFREIVASAPEDTAVEEALLLCLMRVSRYHLCARRPDKSGTPSIALARQYLDDAPEEKISLDALATLCGLSRFQLIRGFARETGITPHAYLVQARLRLARRLLAEGTPRRYRLHGRLCRSKPSDPRVSKAVRHDPGSYQASR